MKKSDGVYRFRLYVAGDAQNSATARANLTAICKTTLAERHDIEVVDVLDDPGRAFADRIFMTPTLVRLSPKPVRTIVGTLSDTEKVLTAMGLSALAA